MPVFFSEISKYANKYVMPGSTSSLGLLPQKHSASADDNNSTGAEKSPNLQLVNHINIWVFFSNLEGLSITSVKIKKHLILTC